MNCGNFFFLNPLMYLICQIFDWLVIVHEALSDDVALKNMLRGNQKMTSFYYTILKRSFFYFASWPMRHFCWRIRRHHLIRFYMKSIIILSISYKCWIWLLTNTIFLIYVQNDITVIKSSVWHTLQHIDPWVVFIIFIFD